MKSRIKKHPTKGEIVSDLVVMLNSEVTDFAIRDLFSQAYAWAWTMNKTEQRAKDKYTKCDHWSNIAKDLWSRSNKFPTGEEFVHEHCVPNKVIAELLIKIRNENGRRATREQINSILERLCHACVITGDEDAKLRKNQLHQKMPDDWDGNSPWSRYLAVGIEVVKIRDADPLKWTKI